ncbi:MAG: hypothetical protein IIV54_05440 [Bacteroidaceae bacterium]|nr:hypothetical protein [Bacteroidaceae bacterium]
MKRIQHIFLYIITLMAILSCADFLEGEYGANDGKMTTSISVQLPQLPDAYPRTRAMAINPDVQTLHLAVFDQNGYLLEYVKAAPANATENDTLYNYTVKLTPTDQPTSIHFIGNGPEQIEWGTEAEAIGRLYTEGGNEAYWEKLEFPNGLRKDGANFHSSVLESLAKVRLARNFAWIKLEKGNAVTNFTIDSYCVVNTQSRGSIAPYNTNTGIFEEFTHEQTYTDLVNTHNYHGFVPAGSTLQTELPAENTWFKTAGVGADNYAYFVYEREKPTSNPTFIIMKGTYTPAGGTPMANRYYKVDLRDMNGEYFPILRNFRYNLQLTSILHEGHASAAAALAGAGSGDVSTSLETQSYTNISNNMARIFVSFTDTTLVNQTDELKLRYKFMAFEIKDANGTTLQKEQVLNGDANVTITQSTPTAGGAVIHTLTKAGSDNSDGWRELTIATTSLQDFRKSQDIIIQGKVTIGEHTYNLQRKVTLNLRPKYTMQLVCDPTEVQKIAGQPFDVIIKVPGGLGQAMFPLEFELEAAAQSMTPNLGDDLPVVTGKSIIPGKSAQTTIGFIKSLAWEDYDALPNVGGYKSVPCHFKTTKAESATAIYADNKYFNQASTTLANYTPATFSNLTFDPDKLPSMVDQPVSFKFTMSRLPSQGGVTVILDHLAPAEGETRLAYQGLVDGKAAYLFANPTETTETLKLKNTATGVAASVTLQAYHFTDASKSMPYTANAFQDLAFNPTTLIAMTTGKPVAFSFKMTNMPSGPVTVVLTNLKPATGESRLTQIVDKANTYTFTPTGLNNTLQLQNTATNTTGRVQLSATNFDNADKTLTIKSSYTIPAGKMNVGSGYDSSISNSNPGTTFSVYTRNPGTSNSTEYRITTFTVRRNRTTPEFELTGDQYNDAMNNGDGNIYVRYTYTSRGWTYYCIATVSLESLLDGTNTVIDLSYSRQY